MDELNVLINEHLKLKNIYEVGPPWIIRNSNIGGRGLFASRDIKEGEIIFRDNPIIIGPRSSMLCPVVCVKCYEQENLYPCSRNCGLPICSKRCENSELHKQECDLINRWKNADYEKSEINLPLLKCLTPIRSLLLTDNQKSLLMLLKSHSGFHHGFEIDILKEKLGLNFNKEEENLMRLTCTVLDANTFEVTVGNEEGRTGLRGLYPLSSLMNHSCIPNTMHNFDENQNMIVKATTFIPLGKELFHSYTRFIWGTPVRRTHLARTKHFFCQCARCEDPSESGTNLSGILCDKCKEVILPFYYDTMEIMWKCVGCNQEITKHKAYLILRVLGSRVNSFTNSENQVEDILNFLKQLMQYLPHQNQISVELKYKLLWILGYNPKYLWSDLSDELLNEKENICRELLKLLETLGAGKNKMRGLLLYELCRCIRERQNRKLKMGARISEDVTMEISTLFEESTEILRDDVHAPTEIKDYNKKRSVMINDDNNNEN